MNSPRHRRRAARGLRWLLPLVVFGLLLCVVQRPGGGVSDELEVVDGEGAVEGRRFDAWMGRGGGAGWIEEGVKLGRERGLWMEALVRKDPERALEVAISRREWSALPERVRAVVEEPFTVVGDLSVRPVCVNGAHGGEATAGAVYALRGAGGEVWEAYPVRGVAASRLGVPVQGVRVGGVAAVGAAMVREERGEWGALETGNADAGRDFLTGEVIGGEAVVGVAGGRRYRFAGEGSMAEMVGLLEEVGGSADVLRLASGGGDVVVSPGDLRNAGNVARLEWTATPKSVLYIRVDFRDVPGAAVRKQALEAVVNGPVSETLRGFSAGRTQVEAEATEEVLRMPEPAAWYAGEAVAGSGSSRNEALLRNAKTAALRAGYALDQYDIIGVAFNEIGMRNGGVVYAGLGSVGIGEQWLQDTLDVDVIVHEFGHNYGLGHASFWEQDDSLNPLGQSGTSVEYGDVYDVMGSGPVPAGHFHPQAKRRLGWMEAARVASVGRPEQSGVYRLQAFDRVGGDGGTLALEVVREANPRESFWVSMRSRFPENESLTRGAYLNWQRAGEARCWLLDTTPGSAGGRGDAGLMLGRTFSDRARGIHVTPVALGGGAGGRWLDVEVNIGGFPNNTVPRVSLAVPAVVRAREAVRFVVTAADAEGDELAFSWDFGDGRTGTNQAGVSHVYQAGGRYDVRVTVSDKRGGVVERTAVVEVIDPLGEWVERESGSVADLKEVAAGNGVAVAVGLNFAIGRGEVLVSEDGVEWSRTLLPVNHYLNAVAFVGEGFLGGGVVFDREEQAWVGLLMGSVDGVEWAELRRGGAEILDVASGGEVKVAVGERGALLVSLNGLEWLPLRAEVEADLLSVTHGSGGFVAVGRGSRGASGDPVILRSETGAAWEAVDIGEASYLRASDDFSEVEADGGVYVASGWFSHIGISTDGGQHWKTRMGNDGRRVEMEGFANGAGLWLAVGRDRNDGNADVNAVSTDGVTWVVQEVEGQADRQGAVYFGGRFLTVGDGGSIWQSGRLEPEVEEPEGWERWRRENFPELGEGSGARDDPDGDGVANYIEYGLDRDPMLAVGDDGGRAGPSVGLDEGANDVGQRLVLEVGVPEPARADVRYLVEAASRLDADAWEVTAVKEGRGEWKWRGDGAAQIAMVASPAGGRMVVRIGDAVSLRPGPAGDVRRERWVRLRMEERTAALPEPGVAGR